MASCMGKSTTSTARERELYRYYQPEDLSKTPDKKRSSNDPCLTAFAQLGAHRLHAKRALITLSTENTEFVLAESGRTLNLQQDEDENDKLWHGVGLVTKGMGPALTYLFSAEDAPSIVDVPDLTKHDEFKNRDKVKQEPGLRSMACVPLRTQLHSIVIGTYIVIHDEVREPLSELDIQFLTDMAITVMDYLEVGRRKQVQFRSERMVKAMGLFIEGKSSLREWWLERGHQSQGTTKKRSRDATPLDRLADAEFGVQETTDYFSRNSLHGLMDDGSRPSVPHSPSSAPSTTTSQIDRTDGRPPIPRGDTMVTDTTPSTLMSHSWHQRNSSVTTFDDTNTDPTPDPEKQSSVAFDLPPNPAAQDESKELQNALLSNDVRGVFARSSNLIREAIGVEGVVYFDASVGSFGGGANKNVMEEKAPGAFHAENAVTTTTSEDDNVPKVSDTDVEPKLGNQQNGELDNNYCNILGFSTRRKSTLRGHQAPEELQKFPEQILRKLLKRYPHGKVFNFDEDGSYSSSESDHKPSLTLDGAQGVPDAGSDGNARKRRISREAEAAAILRVLPGARSVFWFPLWDQARERWFSGSLVWSTACTRTLCPIEDITYLAAFGNSTMAEISRISAQVLSKMKSDFISSISHELRSPLHGVLASVEFLQETEMTEVQTDMVQNIHASGKVLLDTINHVLDFSKVNRRSKKKRSPKRRHKKSDRRGSVDGEGEEKADVCVLSEEVIESVYAGQKISKKAFGSANNHRHSSVGQSLVTVIVDIRYRPNWTFEIDSGAWRRILMNLFSNATKYTAGGFVKVSLEVEDDVASEKKKSRSNLVLKIQDSGMGISQEFLKHQLYKPFTQEDNLASGAGLGLSIVKAIVQDMGGKIDFTSEPGTGTEATVRIPLNASLTPKMDSLKVLDEVREKTKGLTFRLEGFDRYPDITETPTGILSSESEAAMLLKSSVQISFVDWFGMEASNCATSATDILVVMESGLGGKSLEDVLHSHGNEQNEKAVVLVITHTYHSGPRVDSHGHFKIFYLSQPFGPHKVAKILHHAFCGSHLSNSEPPSQIHSRNTSYTGAIPSPSPNSSLLSPTSATLDFATLPTRPQLWSPSPQPSQVQAQVLSPPPAPSLADGKENIAPDQEGKKEKTETGQEKGLRVLLVEDNEINLKLLIATMRKLKLDHATAMNGLEALNSYKECSGDFDVIFMDISMPIMSGIESTRHIRRFEKENNLEPVSLIALTGAGNASTRQEAFSSGVDLFLTKPVPMKALRGMLEDLRKEGRGFFGGVSL